MTGLSDNTDRVPSPRTLSSADVRSLITAKSAKVERKWGLYRNEFDELLRGTVPVFVEVAIHVTGSSMVTVVPTPSLLSILIVPLWSSMMRLVSAMPSPVPPGLRVK